VPKICIALLITPAWMIDVMLGCFKAQNPCFTTTHSKPSFTPSEVSAPHNTSYLLPFAHKLAKTGIFPIFRCMCSCKMTAASLPKAIASVEQHSEVHEIGAARYSGSAVLHRRGVRFHSSAQAAILGMRLSHECHGIY
jgi:hypothetical protein